MLPPSRSSVTPSTPRPNLTRESRRLLLTLRLGAPPADAYLLATADEDGGRRRGRSPTGDADRSRIWITGNRPLAQLRGRWRSLLAMGGGDRPHPESVARAA